ncbi:MAG TPA: EAL domain-containing protein [Thermoanaerobaculia bacterium]|jgi:EAL domain-containing protein (putative c-di-GMP-specific phosphodiesterase class I)|nr:EAL domain-containing protein [Thermoanaerobaculia bacterium]
MADKQAALDRALDEQEDLLLLYQPIHDAKTREIVAAEALLRQRRESGEIREAGIITAAAEDAPRGDLFALDSIVVEKALRDAARWQERAPNVRLHINLSPREFQEGNVLDRLTKLVSGCGIDTRRLTVEITETSYIERPEETMHILEELKKLGIQLWLDDFGTGHSTLTHLQKFPVDGIKIPADFVKCVEENKRCRAITKALITVAHEIGTKVIAEGVEHEKQRESLMRWGCDYIQGFLFSKPMTIDKFETTLR